MQSTLMMSLKLRRSSVNLSGLLNAVTEVIFFPFSDPSHILRKHSLHHYLSVLSSQFLLLHAK